MKTTSQTPFLSEVTDLQQPISKPKLAYFRARLKSRMYAFVISEFTRLRDEAGFTKASLARRLGKKPEQITRWLSEPGNWEAETFSDILIGMGLEPEFRARNLAKGAVSAHEELWKHEPSDAISDVHSLGKMAARPVETASNESLFFAPLPTLGGNIDQSENLERRAINQ